MTFRGEIPSIWSMQNEGSTACLVRDSDPFAELRDRILDHKDDESLLEQDLRGQANDIAELQDLLDGGQVMARKAAGKMPNPVKEKPDYGENSGHFDHPDRVIKTGPDAWRFQSKRKKKACDEAAPVHEEIESMESRVQNLQSEEDELRQQLGDEAEETADLIDLFLGKIAEVDEPKGLDQEHKTYAFELRPEPGSLGKGDNVVTPNGRGKIDKMSEDEQTAYVELESSEEILPYRVSRLRLTEAKRVLAEKRMDLLEDAARSIFDKVEPPSHAVMAAVDVAISQGAI